MKHLYLLFFLLFSTILIGQDITQQVDTKLELLNKNHLTTSILYDRVFPLADLVAFNTTKIDTSHINHFYRAYTELQTADYSNRWGSIQTYKTFVENETTSIPIGIINVDFEYLDKEAISDNLLDIQGPDSLLIDVDNRSRSPYIKKNALVISTLATDTKSTTVDFKMNNSFNLIASNLAIQTLQADFGNGQGYQTLTLSGQKSVTFNSTGLHHIKFKVTFSNGTVKYTYAKIRVNSSPPITKISENITKSRTTSEFCYNDTITASRGFKGYDESTSYKGVGAFEVYKGGSSYDKPIIVLDGFDPFEGTNEGVTVSDIYNEFLEYKISEGSFDNLGFDLRSQGYDIIPLNFIKGEQNDGSIINGGTDYIERNAMVLVELIERINNSSCWSSTVQPIKIMGFSMGGLIGRYALRYMEQNNIPHNTDLFISLDSPHNGAVVPTGLQEAADFIEDLAGIDIADKVLKSPAAKQMLVHHHLSNSKTPEGAPNFHDRFYNTLNTMGFPQQARNIAVSNGFAGGMAINSPNERYFNGEIETGASFPLIGAGADAKMKFSPDRGLTNKVFDLKAKIRFLVFDITVFRRFKEITTNTNQGSYENSPGGYFTAESEIKQFLGDDGVFNTNETLLTGLIFQAKAEISTPRFSFIPVKSSLAYSGGNPDLYENFSTRNLVCTGETPFDSYYTAKASNERHISLNLGTSTYIIDEINGIERGPNILVEDDQPINGPEVVCGTNATYNFANCGANVTNWSVSSNLNIISQTNSYVIVEAINNDINSNAYIQANFVGAPYIRKNITIGEPTFNIYLDPNTFSTWARAEITGKNTEIRDQDIKNVEIEVISSSGGYATIRLENYENSYVVVGQGSSNTWSKWIKFTAVNPCGTIERTFRMTPPPEDPCNNQYTFQSTDVNTYALAPPPEPCSNNLNNANYSTPTSDKENKKNENTTIFVYDFNGRLKQKTKKKEVSLDSYKRGIYILKAQVGAEIYTKKVQKK